MVFNLFITQNNEMQGNPISVSNSLLENTQNVTLPDMFLLMKKYLVLFIRNAK